MYVCTCVYVYVYVYVHTYLGGSKKSLHPSSSLPSKYNVMSATQ